MVVLNVSALLKESLDIHRESVGSKGVKELIVRVVTNEVNDVKEQVEQFLGCWFVWSEEPLLLIA